MAQCRFCNDYSGELVKYGVRHHAHYKCYLDRKVLSDLHDWQIVNFPYKLLKERGLVAVAEEAQQRLNERSFRHRVA